MAKSRRVKRREEQLAALQQRLAEKEALTELLSSSLQQLQGEVDKAVAALGGLQQLHTPLLGATTAQLRLAAASVQPALDKALYVSSSPSQQGLAAAANQDAPGHLHTAADASAAVHPVSAAAAVAAAEASNAPKQQQQQEQPAAGQTSATTPAATPARTPARTQSARAAAATAAKRPARAAAAAGVAAAVATAADVTAELPGCDAAAAATARVTGSTASGGVPAALKLDQQARGWSSIQSLSGVPWFRPRGLKGVQVCQSGPTAAPPPGTEQPAAEAVPAATAVAQARTHVLQRASWLPGRAGAAVHEQQRAAAACVTPEETSVQELPTAAAATAAANIHCRLPGLGVLVPVVGKCVAPDPDVAPGTAAAAATAAVHIDNPRTFVVSEEVIADIKAAAAAAAPDTCQARDASTRPKRGRWNVLTATQTAEGKAVAAAAAAPDACEAMETCLSPKQARRTDLTATQTAAQKAAAAAPAAAPVAAAPAVAAAAPTAASDVGEARDATRHKRVKWAGLTPAESETHGKANCSQRPAAAAVAEAAEVASAAEKARAEAAAAAAATRDMPYIVKDALGQILTVAAAKYYMSTWGVTSALRSLNGWLLQDPDDKHLDQLCSHPTAITSVVKLLSHSDRDIAAAAVGFLDFMLDPMQCSSMRPAPHIVARSQATVCKETQLFDQITKILVPDQPDLAAAVLLLLKIYNISSLEGQQRLLLHRGCITAVTELLLPSLPATAAAAADLLEKLCTPPPFHDVSGPRFIIKASHGAIYRMKALYASQRFLPDSELSEDLSKACQSVANVLHLLDEHVPSLQLAAPTVTCLGVCETEHH